MCMLMCMCMLTKRTNILFEEEMWKQLTRRAKSQNTSVGELVRTAIVEKYPSEKELEQRREAIDRIMKMKEEYRKAHPSKKKHESTVSLIQRMRRDRDKHLLSLLK